MNGDIKYQYPPNYAIINLAFPENKKHQAIFTYGKTIYNPFKVQTTPDLEFHERIHTRQQGDNPEIWWNRYIEDVDFRLSQEIEAYGEQYKFFKENANNPKISEWLLDKLSLALSGELYGNIISYGEARSKIRRYGKN